MDGHAKITVKGMVQGVGYRWFADRAARKLQLNGFVENLPNGDVFAEVEGPEGMIHEYIQTLRTGPSRAHVDDVIVEWEKPAYLFINFRIKA
jgi:acylphosphatase